VEMHLTEAHIAQWVLNGWTCDAKRLIFGFVLS